MKQEIENYLAQRTAEGLADQTITSYRHRLERLLKYTASRRVNRWQAVQPEHVDGFLKFLHASGLAFGSREGCIITAMCFFRWLAENGRILFNPARHIEVPRPDKDDLPLTAPPLAEEDVANLLATMPRRNAVDLRDIVQIDLLYSAGLRLSESIALDVKDIDFTNRLVRVRKGKGSKERDVPMMRGLQSTIRDYLCLRRTLLHGPDDGALLLTRSGGRMKKGTVEQLMDRLNSRRKGKQRVHAHLFRHSIAVHLLRGGTDIRYVQFFLGHESLESTRIYLRLVPADLRAAYDAAMPEFSFNP